MKNKLIFWDWTGTLADESELDKYVCKTIEEEVAKKENISLEKAEKMYKTLLKSLENNWRWHDYFYHCNYLGINWEYPQKKT